MDLRAWLPVSVALVGCGQSSADLGASQAAISTPVCSDTRYIAYITGLTNCDSLPPPTADWEVRDLFPPKAWESSAPGRLAWYCVFEWEPPTPSTPEPPPGFLQAQLEQSLPEGARVGPDCLGLTTHSVADAHWRDLSKDFVQYAGGIEHHAPSMPAPVPLSIIDSWPDASGPHWTRGAATVPEAKLDHGYTLARIAEVLTCPSGSPGACLTQTRSIQAFARDQSGLFSPAGIGTHGYISELASAVYHAVRHDDALGFPASGVQVLNLSLGWAPLPAMGGDIGDIELGEKAAAAAVHEALQYAACRGALAFAAAGNGLGPKSKDAIYPAAWVMHQALSPPGCAGEFGVSSSPTLRPLVSAVGAVHEDGRAFELTREGSEPAFTAYGQHAVVGLEVWPPERTAVLTGSSVSTVVVSAAVAAAWALVPYYSADDILDAVYFNSAPTGRVAALHDGVRPDVRRVGVCAATEGICAATGACGGYWSCPSASSPAFEPFSITLTSVSGSASACAPPDVLPSGSAPACDGGLEGAETRPHTLPQPGDVVCTVCLGKFDAALRELDLSLDLKSSGDFRPSWLHIEDASGTYGVNLRGYFPKLLAGGTRHGVELENLAITGSGPFTAKLYFELVTSSGGWASTAAELKVY